jgi:formyl-CoA transferase
VQTRLLGVPVPHRPPREQAPNALANHYRCRDDRWFIMALFNEERQWRPFVEAIGRTSLADDPRFATREARRANARALVILLDETFAKADMAEWRQRLDAVGVTFGVVATLDDVPGDGQTRAIEAVVPFVDAEGLTVSSPFQIDGERKVGARNAPALGQHSEEVLREAGYSADEVARLRERGVVG